MNPIAIVIRVLVIAAVVPLAGWAFDLATTGGDKSGGANIGAGLFAFTVGAVLAFVWGIVDGRRTGLSFLTLLGRWALVCALAALLGWAVLWLREGYDVATAMSDLTSLTPFFFATIFGPSVVGVLIGWVLRRTPPPDPAAPEPA
ncbi:MAG TPA: hypothetical protein GXZ60_13670 [Intrasporangiaceae bacterium]|nr:hypothetical protein [Intrasporangiaceae bacterium]